MTFNRDEDAARALEDLVFNTKNGIFSPVDKVAGVKISLYLAPPLCSYAVASAQASAARGGALLRFLILFPKFYFGVHTIDLTA